MYKDNQKKEKAFEKKSIKNEYQLRRWFPLRYIDNSVETGITEDGKHVVLFGTLIKCNQNTSAKGTPYLKALLKERNSNKIVSLIYLNQPKRYYQLIKIIQQPVIVSGTLSINSYGISIMNPECTDTDIQKWMGMIPVFSKIGNLKDYVVRNAVKDALTHDDFETIPEEIRRGYNICNINEALFYKNFPRNNHDIEIADRRLIFDDLFYLASRFELTKRASTIQGIKIEKTEITDAIIKKLPYTLTEDQSQIYEKIKNNMLQGKHIKALIQGDVSCGKTIIAFLISLLAIENGYQALIMAPTKILAGQHFDKMKALVEGLNINILLVSGKQITKKQKADLEQGKYDIAIGTHGLASDTIKFKNLGMTVIDEEHKFGVEQRKKIEKRQEEANSISMTATPIPRTLGNIIYGNDTEIYSVHSMPGCRKPIKTLYDNGKDIYSIISPILIRKEQIYIVCPAIDTEEEKMPGVLNTHQAFQMYSKLFPQASIAELNGKLKQTEADEIIKKFKEGNTDILISTTIIEVGVDVPNATMIVIHNAERFGLAGMHQLRGRVGRGSKQSYCVLVSEKTPQENDRIKAFIEVRDGFKISERDLELRKTGNLFGQKQSGYNKYIDEMINNEDFFNSIKQCVSFMDDKYLVRHINKTILTEKD